MRKSTHARMLNAILMPLLVGSLHFFHAPFAYSRLGLEDGVVITVTVATNCETPKHFLKSFDVKVAKRKASRSKGLSGKKTSLSKNEGMLFIFDPPEKPQFWMKDTYVPLQLAFFDKKKKLIQLLEMTPEQNPDRPTKRYSAKQDITAALELKPNSIPRSYVGKAKLCLIDD